MNNKNNKGQVMLISILILGGIMIASTAIGSALLIFQIKQVNNAGDSAIALFAADSGIEAVTWCFFDKSEDKGNCTVPERVVDSFCPADNLPEVDFEDSSISLETNCVWDKVEGVVTITSRASKAGATRILQAQFIQEDE
ncbi:MAG: hypothetical protein WDZ80_04395 [Candidatus Paceibacterota bacterium]